MTLQAMERYNEGLIDYANTPERYEEVKVKFSEARKLIQQSCLAGIKSGQEIKGLVKCQERKLARDKTAAQK